ncbi:MULTISPECIES: helix-turn-helix domain-containing protein [unclassified Chryseobacterium]|uniref:helix-turn-helix domain-containing protein n=1 Tax=unclassified Chryseobacterium TaxID=2593645 RepID=UPI000E0AF3B9|nr:MULTISPECIES: helix-turn-helix domain-containing protein [unclassified Chryseobacterium]MDQ1857110.1 helix-turn-helix domain-containing protein [Chryseobacterium sp. WLY505]
MTTEKDIKIEQYKRQLVYYYNILMSVILAVFGLIYTFIIPDKIMAWYLFGGLFLMVYTYLIVRKTYSVNVMVHSYIIIATLYNFYIMLAFWNNSIASFVWLIPIPLAAYVFFERKYVFIYSMFVLLNIIAGYLISKTFSFKFPIHRPEDVRITDTILMISNVAVISLLLYFKDKIKRVEIYHEFEEKNSNTVIQPVSVAEKAPFADELFEKIESVMRDKQLYKDVNFNISKLSTEMDINSSYISKSIRAKGYPNFNNYLNMHRIECVKRLLHENDIEKVTLMYIYTEAGFSNQSTFNRVFKQMENITPSEYINSLQLH